ncbi:hypothetical protein [Parabacteroides gordonii]|uniref:Major fimbrial subunit protein N-terminal domain-containing protein n=1 Tax=Parabacteroides gordonii MS-1 = DSM 23371 TaxID=1203610 RepID=A0A0F5JDJ5_9BACT|nr:hypothetical protein [Parabacteroides gordonii]KKB55849.1 hypothetical protein HMPREF1536_03324 [Parabacteroides gordonii MS-1 = DSM 23371]MCA5581369.1 hypothetical protein [Parabacteroides gordonii]RGP18361.1 hypothetical protein DXB27_02780 [Parabacteroides gordonii]
MKKSKFLAFAALGLLTLASCSDSNDPIIEGNEQQTGEQIIVLDMQDTDVLSTKSRPLYSTSNKGAETVTDLQLLVFKVETDNQKTFVKSIHVPDWDLKSSKYDYGQKMTIRLTGDDKIKEDEIGKGGQFTVVAVGQDEKTEEPKPFTFGGNGTKLSALNIETTPSAPTWSSAAEAGKGFSQLFTDAIDNYATPASEIFSGESEPTLLAFDEGAQINVLLKRQVAGVLGYFNRIPAKVGDGADAKHVGFIRLVSSARNKQLDLTTHLPKQEDDATEDQSKDAETIVNGFEPATANAKFKATADASEADDAYIVYEIDLAKWFPGGVSAETPSTWSDDAIDNDGLLKADNWINAISAANSAPTLAQGAVFAGEFMIPFNHVEKTNTFELQLLGFEDSGEKAILKSWNVKLDRASWDSGKKDDANIYNIYRNHLYQIGKRGSGDDPDQPGVDPDKPQPLDKDQDLTIRINDQWEFIHDMEIE